MKKPLIPLLALACLLACLLPARAEEPGTALRTARVTHGSRAVPFLYPANCKLQQDGDLGTFVHLDDEAYVVVVLLEEGQDVIQRFTETKAPEMEILHPAQDMALLAFRSKVGYGFPGWPTLDVLEVGVTLPDGAGLIIQSTCPAGEADVYPVLLTIVDSITDAQPLQRWLEETWLPGMGLDAALSGLTPTTYMALTDAYTAAYGSWWSWDMPTWLDYRAALCHLPLISSRTGTAIAATEYVLPPEGAISGTEAAALALLALDMPDARFHSCVYFQVQGQVVCKASLTLDGTVAYAVEMDAMTGAVLGVYERIPTEGAGQFFVPQALWQATSAPGNG